MQSSISLVFGWFIEIATNFGVRFGAPFSRIRPLSGTRPLPSHKSPPPPKKIQNWNSNSPRWTNSGRKKNGNDSRGGGGGVAFTTPASSWRIRRPALKKKQNKRETAKRSSSSYPQVEAGARVSACCESAVRAPHTERETKKKPNDAQPRRPIDKTTLCVWRRRRLALPGRRKQNTLTHTHTDTDTDTETHTSDVQRPLLVFFSRFLFFLYGRRRRRAAADETRWPPQLDAGRSDTGPGRGSLHRCHCGRNAPAGRMSHLTRVRPEPVPRLSRARPGCSPRLFSVAVASAISFVLRPVGQFTQTLSTSSLKRVCI